MHHHHLISPHEHHSPSAVVSGGGGGFAARPASISGKRHSDHLNSFDDEEGDESNNSDGGDLLRKSLKVDAPDTPTSNSKRSGVKSSDFRGVSKCAKDGRWQSRIRVGKKVKYLGRFKTEIDAARKYDEAALALHGRRSTLNFEMTEEEVELALANAVAKRLELGLMDGNSNNITPTSRLSSRSVSPTGFDFDEEAVAAAAAAASAAANAAALEEEDEATTGGEEEENSNDAILPPLVLPARVVAAAAIAAAPVAAAAAIAIPSAVTTNEDQNAAVCLLWMKMNLGKEVLM